MRAGFKIHFIDKRRLSTNADYRQRQISDKLRLSTNSDYRQTLRCVWRIGLSVRNEEEGTKPESRVPTRMAQFALGKARAC
eukprot:2491408-Rhodomonas_salina.2